MKRGRRFLGWLLLMLMLGLLALDGHAQEQTKKPQDTPYRSGRFNAITDVPGVMVGHFTYRQGATLRGTTAILLGQYGGVCAVDVRGGNPLTIGTHTFDPTTINLECNAIVLTGGSAFGLSAASGVVDFLYDHGRGVETRVGRIPIVPAAVIFDLPVGDAKVHPQPSWGYKAAEQATDGPVQQGNVGAGAGATMGKTPAGIPLKGGLGTASAVLPNNVVVSAIVVLNSLGDVVNPVTGELYAVSGGYDRVLLREQFQPRAPTGSSGAAVENTTLAVIVTNARLSKVQLTKVAQLAQDGLARAIRPVHSMLDGDVIFAVSVGWNQTIPIQGSYPGEEVDIVGAAAADVLLRAILNGIHAAETIPGWTSYRDWQKARLQAQEKTPK